MGTLPNKQDVAYVFHNVSCVQADCILLYAPRTGIYTSQGGGSVDVASLERCGFVFGMHDAQSALL